MATLSSTRRPRVKRLNVEKNTGYLIFRKPPLSKIVTISLGREGCHYFGKCDYFWCDYYEWGQYFYFWSPLLLIPNFLTNPRSLIYSICVLTVASNNEKSLSSCQSSTKLLSTIEASRSKILLLTSLSSRSSSSRFAGFLRSLSVKEFRSLSNESRLSNKSISSLRW